MVEEDFLVRLRRVAGCTVLLLTLSAVVVVCAWVGLQPTQITGVEDRPDGFLQTLSHKLHQKIDGLLDMHDSQGEG
jgi:hypothetical protein